MEIWNAVPDNEATPTMRTGNEEIDHRHKYIFTRRMPRSHKLAHRARRRGGENIPGIRSDLRKGVEGGGTKGQQQDCRLEWVRGGRR